MIGFAKTTPIPKPANPFKSQMCIRDSPYSVRQRNRIRLSHSRIHTFHTHLSSHISVSYTHLDVYKRQAKVCAIARIAIESIIPKTAFAVDNPSAGFFISFIIVSFQPITLFLILITNLKQYCYKVSK